MAEYTKVFDNPYPNGWEDLPSENTPITAHALQEHTDAIEHIENYLDENPIKDSTDVSWNQIQTSGTKIAEITIDGQKKDVFSPKGGGTSFEVGNELALENDVLRYKANYGTSAQFDTFKADESVPVGSTYRVTDDYIDDFGIMYANDSSRDKNLSINMVGGAWNTSDVIHTLPQGIYYAYVSLKKTNANYYDRGYIRVNDTNALNTYTHFYGNPYADSYVKICGIIKCPNETNEIKIRYNVSTTSNATISDFGFVRIG